MGLLTETATSATELLGADGIAVVADSGYFKIEDIEACEKAGMTPYVPRPQRGPAVRAGLFRKDEFRYDPARDSVLCPAGHRLEAYTSSVIRGLKKVNYVNKEACRDCPLRARCTKGRTPLAKSQQGGKSRLYVALWLSKEGQRACFCAD